MYEFMFSVHPTPGDTRLSDSVLHFGGYNVASKECFSDTTKVRRGGEPVCERAREREREQELKLLGLEGREM